MKENNLINRLAAVLSHLEEIPHEELEWLVTNGKFEVFENGTLIAPKGKHMDKLSIILSGYIAVKRDYGTGPRQIAKWGVGEVIGMLPYSRMTGSNSDIYLEERSEFLSINEKSFPDMIHRCPVFTAYTVHTMIDRTRSINTSGLQAEKMISLGKLSAGLAHELNNPASAAVRSSQLLLSELDKAEAASRALGTINLNDDLLDTIERIRSACLVKSADSILSPIQQAEREDEIADWLTLHNIEKSLAEPLSTTTITINELNELSSAISSKSLAVVIQWIATACSTRSLAMDIEQAATRISELVSTVKRFTYMDKFAGLESVGVEAGLRDTIRIVSSKVKSKGAAITIDIEPNLPQVEASGGGLNQVWLNLIDNALDAIPNSGHVDVIACMEEDRIVVKIIDNGSGIPHEIVSQIFDPFFTTKPPGQGTGLGLDVTRRLLNQYHGYITVNSKPGRTEFRVSLKTGKSAKDKR